ncbi:MAG: diphosphate--fructose-6-phosphate 1-phosphotransferase [Waddliaceae bacterium]
MKSIEEYRLKQQPELPESLQNLKQLSWSPCGTSKLSPDCVDIFTHLSEQHFLIPTLRDSNNTTPLRIGAVFSGGQAAGGHNVLSGLYDAIKQIHKESVLFGFLNGPSGIVNGEYEEITDEQINRFRNLGGFDMIGSGRTKIETLDQFEKAAKVIRYADLDGLVIIGGDDSNTNAALLAEYFLDQGIKTRVIGVPKTIDGDLKNAHIPTSFGFDTATKTYSATIGSILRDSLSAKKYWFFIKLMGRSASHIACECALQTHPNLTLIGEEVDKEGRSFQDLVLEIADLIELRANKGKNYGAILIPEGIIEFIPEFKNLIQELNRKVEPLSSKSDQCLTHLPKFIQDQLLLDRDPHGNVKVSQIETERLFIEAVKEELVRRGSGHKFSAQPIFCGYEGRSCLPSIFDSNYCYALGHVAASLIQAKQTGYMAAIQNVQARVKDWEIAGIPLTSMIHMEERKGKMKPVIEKALVELDGPIFARLASQRENWKSDDDYRYPGPIQFFGPEELTHQTTISLQLTPAKVLEKT